MRTLFFRASRFLPLMVSCLGIAIATAQTRPFKPGDKIEYKESSTPEVWESGVFVGATPDGRQPIIRKKPNQFYKDGAQTAFDWNNIRTVRSAVAPKVSIEDADVGAVSNKPVPAVSTKGGVLTQEEILSFLEKNFGNDPFGNPRREEIQKELAQLIKARGLAFRHETLSDFSNKIGKYGVTSVVTFPLGDNFGPPTQERWLIGKWNLSKIGATVDYVKDRTVYRQTEIGVKDVGSLTISPDHKFAWKGGTPTGVLKGEWRPATPDEMKTQGGEGVVLIKAKGGVDWIVMQDRTTQLKGHWVKIAQLESRQIREGGFRE